MSYIVYTPTQRVATLTRSHITSLMSKIECSAFGGHITKAADTNFEFVCSGKGSPRHSDVGGICLTIWGDKDHSSGKALIIICADNIGMDAYKAYHAFEDAVDPARYSTFFA